MESSSGRGVIYTRVKRDVSWDSPFTLKVGQVFTGFGIGCGIGIGIGRPLNLGSIPVLNQVMVAARVQLMLFLVCKDMSMVLTCCEASCGTSDTVTSFSSSNTCHGKTWNSFHFTY